MLDTVRMYIVHTVHKLPRVDTKLTHELVSCCCCMDSSCIICCICPAYLESTLSICAWDA